MKVNTFNKEVRWRTSDGSIPRTVLAPVAASATIKKGDVLALSSGQVAQAIALPGSNDTQTSAGGVTLYGIAAANITTTASVDEADDRIPVVIFDDTLEIGLRIYNATAADAEPQDLTVGTNYQLGRWRGSSANVWWYMADTGTTNGELSYVERAQDNDADYGFAWFKVNSSYREMV